MAMAVAAMTKEQVRRIVLVRRPWKQEKGWDFSQGTLLKR